MTGERFADRGHAPAGAATQRMGAEHGSGTLGSRASVVGPQSLAETLTSVRDLHNSILQQGLGRRLVTEFNKSLPRDIRASHGIELNYNTRYFVGIRPIASQAPEQGVSQSGGWEVVLRVEDTTARQGFSAENPFIDPAGVKLGELIPAPHTDTADDTQPYTVRVSKRVTLAEADVDLVTYLASDAVHLSNAIPSLNPFTLRLIDSSGTNITS